MSVIRNACYGFVIGDAIGVPIEFVSRRKLTEEAVTTMLGYGSYDVPAGTWSDDTAMTLATMDSIVKCNGEIRYNDIADRFCNWMNRAEYTTSHYVFDIGIITKYSLIRYLEEGGDATKCGGTRFGENGNGSLMRMLPIVFYCYYNHLSDEKVREIVQNVSSITHGHEISILGCYLYVRYLLSLLEGNNKYDAYYEIQGFRYDTFSLEAKEVYQRILKGNIAKESMESIKSNGYIVDTLEAVFWVILNTNSYEESVIQAINLGEDTDTVGAITGSIAGILYGDNSIPKEWMDALQNKEYFDTILNPFEELYFK